MWKLNCKIDFPHLLIILVTMSKIKQPTHKTHIMTDMK